MAEVYQSFPVQSGEQVVLPIDVDDRDGNDVDLTGASARFAMARGPDKLILLDSDASPSVATAVITVANPGEVTVTIPDEQTEALIGDYYFEVKVTDSLGAEGTVTKGWMTFTPNLI